MLKRLQNWLAMRKHMWVTTSDGMNRRCCVCGQREEMDLGGGMQGSMWMIVEHGDKAAHRFNPPAARPASAPSSPRIPQDEPASVD